MKQLILTVTETGRKTGKYLYQVFNEGELLAERRSDRVYVAAHVYRNVAGGAIVYGLPYFYGRMDLVGKNKDAANGAWALATIKK